MFNIDPAQWYQCGCHDHFCGEGDYIRHHNGQLQFVKIEQRWIHDCSRQTLFWAADCVEIDGVMYQVRYQWNFNGMFERYLMLPMPSMFSGVFDGVALFRADFWSDAQDFPSLPEVIQGSDLIKIIEEWQTVPGFIVPDESGFQCVLAWTPCEASMTV